MLRGNRFTVALLALGIAMFANLVNADPPAATPAAAAPTAVAPTAAAGDAKSAPSAVEPAAAPFSGSVETAEWLEKIYAGHHPPEAIRMLIAIARGSQMGSGQAWFGPAQTRYDWGWLAGLHDSGDGISAEAFRGKPEWFAKLDRNKDGRIVADDFDWSDRNPYVQMSSFVNRLFRKMNVDGDLRLTREELAAFFDKAALGKDYATADDLRDALLTGVSGSFKPGDAPTPELLVRGLFAGETGSINEGPSPGDPAPDFTLKTHDGKQTIRLSDLRGSKPVVLVFGNFTCGPFRGSYPMIDELCQRYKDDAIFLSVYVREAHPSDGWAMLQNSEAGVDFAQPRTFDERAAVAQVCHAKLNYSMPLLVDEINDPVGHAYSGMPSRLYVVDPNGIVAFKNGRGPFGFKTAELEQAIVMCLLERYAAATPLPAAAAAAEATGK
ncbi:MAG TPA: deiodinase family protein [Pirellulales bacterium]|nr:deiodinase family protein [Pirellulales bacterium]